MISIDDSGVVIFDADGFMQDARELARETLEAAGDDFTVEVTSNLRQGKTGGGNSQTATNTPAWSERKRHRPEGVGLDRDLSDPAEYDVDPEDGGYRVVVSPPSQRLSAVRRNEARGYTFLSDAGAVMQKALDRRLAEAALRLRFGRHVRRGG